MESQLSSDGIWWVLLVIAGNCSQGDLFEFVWVPPISKMR